MMTTTVIQTEKAEVVKYLVRAMRYYEDKKEMLIVPYNTGSHWVLLTISMRHNQIWYCDSNRPTDPATGKRGTRDYSEVLAVLNEYVHSPL
jgi:Ulp1 family protease